ncbi:MAG: LPXTG cell wall anchor domain-containing protein [Acidimicrobiales bacterium]
MQRSRTLRLLVAMAFSVVSLVALAPVAHADDSYTGTCSIVVAPSTVQAGHSVNIVAKGFNAGAEVTFTVDQTLVIGTAIANAGGVAHIQWDVPADFADGQHVITASGDGCTDPVQVSAEITVVSAAEQTKDTTGTLPRTGGDYTNLLRLGILLVAAGGLVVLATRKRSSESTSV